MRAYEESRYREHVIEPYFQAIRAEWLGWMQGEYLTPTAV